MESALAERSHIAVVRSARRCYVSMRFCTTADASAAGLAPLPLTAHRIELDDGRQFDLQLPAEYTISPALQGLKRVRFFALSPDQRVFVTDMHDLSDNRRGVVYVLDGWNAAEGRFNRAIPYLTGLRNPNSIAFHADTEGRQWLYLALTDKLVRYRYHDGDNAPQGEAEPLATFPDYGLSYKYGGWHLTRSIAFADNGKLYVSVGSSCNACIEKEPVRASVLEMNPDGSESREYARGTAQCGRTRIHQAWPGRDQPGRRSSRPRAPGRNPVSTRRRRRLRLAALLPVAGPHPCRSRIPARRRLRRGTQGPGDIPGPLLGPGTCVLRRGGHRFPDPRHHPNPTRRQLSRRPAWLDQRAPRPWLSRGADQRGRKRNPYFHRRLPAGRQGARSALRHPRLRR